MTAAADNLVPPPWRMRGQGWILLCQWPKRWLIDNGWVPAELADRYAGGPGALMLVDYQECPIGPYRELLMVPGRFRTPAGTRPSITRILVSSQISVDNGRAHWAIPKTLGGFEIEKTERGERWSISEGEKPLARYELRERGPSLPVSSRFSPKSLGTIAQPTDDGWLLTRPRASGRLRWADVDAGWSDPSGFPQLAAGRCFMALRVKEFRMKFAAALRVAAD